MSSLYTSILHILPAEIIIKVLQLLQAPDMVKCRQLCKSIKYYIDTSAVLQYSIVLALSGYEDGPSDIQGNTSSAALRLQRLYLHLHSWVRLDWSAHRIEIPSNFGAYELVGGVLGMIIPPGTMIFVQLPSAVRNTPLRQWIHPDAGFSIELITIDPEQNLLVILELFESDGVDYTLENALYLGRLHVHSLDRNIAHQSTSDPIIQASRLLRGSNSLEVMGDKLGLLSQGSITQPATLRLWLWKTGNILMNISLHPFVTSFCFINPFTIALPHYRPRDQSSNDHVQTSLRVISLGSSHHEHRELLHFDLPAVHSGVGSVLNIYTSPSPQPPSSAPFLPSAEDRTIMLEWITEGEPELSDINDDPNDYDLVMRTYQIFTSAHALKKYVRPSNSTLFIPWESWGPRHSRFMRSQGSPNIFASLIHGNRFVHFTSPNVLRVLDFSPCLLSMEATAGPTRLRVIDVGRNNPERVLRPEIFESGVMSTLPYRSVERHLDFALRGQYRGSLMCDDEHILLFEALENNPIAHMIILTM